MDKRWILTVLFILTVLSGCSIEADQDAEVTIQNEEALLSLFRTPALLFEYSQDYYQHNQHWPESKAQLKAFVDADPNNLPIAWDLLDEISVTPAEDNKKIKEFTVTLNTRSNRNIPLKLTIPSKMAPNDIDPATEKMLDQIMFPATQSQTKNKQSK